MSTAFLGAMMEINEQVINDAFAAMHDLGKVESNDEDDTEAEREIEMASMSENSEKQQ
jgi:hypothetical protein